MDIVQMIIQAGSVGVALYALHVLRNIVENHLNHSNDIMRELTKAIEGLKQLIRQHIKVGE